MANANLLEILDRESKLDNMIIYGNVRCAIDKPSFLSKSVKVTEGFFALVDVLALRCNGVDYFGQYSGHQDSKHIYFSKGSIVVVLDDKSLIGKNVRVFGRSLNGCTIKKQRTAGLTDGIVGFAWTKQNGEWALVPNKVKVFGESDVRGTVLEEYLVSLVSGVPFSYPKSVESIMEYQGVKDYKPLEMKEISGAVEYSTSAIDISGVPLELVHRLKPVEKSEFTEAVGESVEDLQKKSKSYSEELVKYIKKRVLDEEMDEKMKEDLYDFANSIISNFVNEIVVRDSVSLGNISKTKGKDIVEEFLDEFAQVKFRGSNDEENEKLSSSKLYSEIESLRKMYPLNAGVMSGIGSIIPFMSDRLQYASLVMAEVSGVGVEDIVSNHNTCYSFNGLDTKEWFWCLAHNPYICGLLGGGLSVVDCDILFYAFTNKCNMEECIRYRDILIMVMNIKNYSSRSTLIPRRDLLSMSGEYPRLGKKRIEDFGYPYPRSRVDAIGLVRKGVGVDKKLFLFYIDTRKVLDYMNKIGLVEDVNDGIILTSDLAKEYVIYNTLIDKSSRKTGISRDEIDKVIGVFENNRGFKLENLQKDGVHLVENMAGVLSGCAGSGKTTTSDCLVECIKKYLPQYELRFGAPTGKAARRLAEVVGGNVKTIHSMFGLGLDSKPVLSRYSRTFRKNQEGVNYAYILDEMAMCSTDLMYEIVNSLDKDDIIYFLGDVKQLPPIGKGAPFRSMMKFLPCIELGVSKRAAENGKINYNCGLINFVSDSYVVELQGGDDFEIVPCSDADIQRVTVNTFARMLERFKEDDIQVVTGYQNDRYPWSTTNLNPYLQNLLRDETDLLYFYNNRRFMRNDRVIHVKRNAYDIPRYLMRGRNHFEEVVTHGVVNGELGKLLGYVKASECQIESWDSSDMSEEERASLPSWLAELIEKRENSSVDVRDENEFKSDDSLYYIMVQVYDVDLKEDVVLLYHAHYREKNNVNSYTRVFSGGDLGYIDLAYALTTHKMQGSQSECIIIPLGASGSPEFMNRNMLNTMITRASEKVVLIGSVKGKDSALTHGRRITNTDEGEDVLRLLAEI